MKNWRKIITGLILSTVALSINAAGVIDQMSDSLILAKADSIRSIRADNKDKVIIGNDTVNMIIPEKNYGRYDRGLFNYMFIPKGQWSFGLTVSYGSLNTEDLKFLSFLSDLDVNGSAFSLKPYISYFFRNNSSIGMRLGYVRNNLNLNSFVMDIDDDLSFSISDVLYHTENYSASIFYRHYIGLDRSKRFGVFNEVDLAFVSGTGQFRRKYNGEPKDTRTITSECRLNFSPGLCVFVHDNVSFNVSFGIFGLYFKNEKQKTNGEDEGSRFSSGANFKFNLFNINLGIAVHI